MDEEVINDLYSRAQSKGYTKSREEFVNLLHTDSSVLNDMYSYVKSKGYNKDINSFSSIIGKEQSEPVPVVKKKDFSVSTKSQEPQAGTMESPSEDGSSVTVSQEVKDKQAILTKRALDKYKKDNEKPFSSPLAKVGIGTVAVLGEHNKTWYSFADDLIVNARKSLQDEGFFDDDIPDTDTPITDAVKKKISPESEDTDLSFFDKVKLASQVFTKTGPLGPSAGTKLTAKLASKVINSSLPQDKKNAVIASLNQADAHLKKRIKDVEELQKYALPEDNIPINVTKGIVGMAPDLLIAATMKTPAASEGALAKFGTKVSKDAKPLIAKYVPKAAKFIEEAVRAPFTKIMATKGAISEMANAEEGEDMIDAGVEGGIKGGLEGVYMHTLGVVAGKAMPVIAKQISRTSMNSKFATAIANPLSNAGVFATARALRTPIEEGRLATGEELALEAGMGVGFSLLHAGKLYKTHNEANHYYDNTLKTDPLDSFGRVVNETKENLDLAYNPDLTEAQVKELESARDELKAAIIKEPDLNNKKLLGNEAVKIQNQLDAHSAIKAIVENRETLVEQINSNENLNQEQKEFYTKKVEAIADHFDNSEYGLKKKDLDSRIKQTEKDLSDLSETFTNLTKASDRKIAKIKIEEQRKKLEDLNKELDDLVTNKYKEDAVQKQTADESVLRTEQPELGLQEMGEGNAKPEGLTEEQTIINAKPEEVVEPSLKISEALNEPSGVFVYDGKKGQLKTIDKTLVLETPTEVIDIAYDLDNISDKTLEEFGVSKEEELNFKLNEDNSIELNGKKYENNYSNPESAFGRDKEGNYTVTLETENGQKRTFRGQQADRIVYETRLKNFEQNGTERQIEDAHAAADEAIRIETEARESAPKREGKSVRKGKQRTLKTVKEPLTKAEREAEVKPQEIEVVTDTTPVIEAEVAPTEKIKGGDILDPNSLLNDKQLTFQEWFDLSNSELKDIESKERTLPVQKEYEAKIREINRIKERAAKASETTAETAPVETINLEQITKNSYVDRISRNIIEKVGNNWVVKTEVEGKELFKSKTLKGAKEFVSNDNKEALRVQPTETKAEAVPIDKINDLLNLDTKEKTNLQKVSDYLDKLDKSLDLDPNELNDVTRVMAVSTAKAVIKTLKALVNAGMTLQKAIQMASEAHKVKEEQIIDALDIVSKINENKSEGISEMELPGYNKLSKVIDSAISNGKTIDNILNYMNRSEVYKNATDVQKELLVRDVRKRFGLKEKSAPSVGKLFGKIKDIAKITMTEKAALVKQIKDTAKGARQSIQEWRKQTQELTKDLAELQKSGKITTSQEKTILNKFGKVNIFSEKSVARFTDYMAKVFADADYKQKLSNARGTLESIKDLVKNENKNGDLRALGSEFAKIDPSAVENIDEYNDISKKIKEAIDGSKIRKSDTKFAETVNIQDTTAYIEKTLKEQEAKLREEKINELQDLLDVDASKFSAEEIDTLLDIYGAEEKGADTIKYNEGIIRAAVKKGFDIYSTVIKEMIRTGEDPFTGEKVSFDKKQKDLIERFMKIDPNKIAEPKDALRIVDSLINFIQNKSTAGMLRPIADFEGISEPENIVKKGIKAIRLRKYFSPKLGRALGQKTTTLPVLEEKMFKGVERSLEVSEETGVSDLINNSSKAESEVNLITKEYVKEFYKRKANGESYNSAYNDIERGVFAHMNRNVIGTEQRMKKVFDKRKQEVLDVIDLLSKNGSDSEIETAKLIQKAYDKILDKSENIKDARSKTDINNVEGVDYWVKQWDGKYDALSDLSINFYNKKLERDLGYTPDRLRYIEGSDKEVDLENNESAFLRNTDGVLYNKKSGSLTDKQEERKIPKDMYVDFSFDKKNANAMSDALTDLYTAFDIRKVQSFLNSNNFRKVIPSSKDANLYKKRIEKFVRITRKKSPYSNSEVSDFIKKADKLAKIGVTMSLASGKQPFIQTIPVMASTAINAGGVGIGASFDPSYNKWLNEAGYAVSNRGVESQAQLESLNKLLDKASEMPLEKALKFVENVQDAALKNLLVKPDVWIARSSFKAYYEQSLKKQGLKSSNIDYSNHEVNKKAANYAQRMVDRQQNISNPALAGDLYTSESNAQKAFIKMLMPFSSFRMNQSSRLGSDLSTLEYWNTSTKSDKVIALRSIAGYGVEAAAYRGLQIGVGMLFYSLAQKIMGNYDEEEEKKYKESLIKNAVSGSFADTFSPVPLSDPFTQDALAYSVDEIQELMDKPEDERIKLFGSKEQSALKMFGTYGIPIERAKDIYQLGKLAYSRKFTDKYGNEKEISEEDANNLKTLIGPLFAASAIGAFSPDVNAITRRAKKMAENKSKTTEPKEGAYEDYEKSKDKKVILDSIIDSSYDQDIIDAAEQKKKDLQYAGTDYQKAMNKKEKREKEKLLFDPETGTQYDNEEDLKKYNETLWDENFGPNSDWEQEHQYEDAVDKMVTDALTKKEEEEYNYVKPKKKKKTNSDGTRKRSK